MPGRLEVRSSMSSAVMSHAGSTQLKERLSTIDLLVIEACLGLDLIDISS